MAEQKQTIVQPAAAPNKPKGARKDVNIKSAFPDSPLHKGEITDLERKKLYQALALDGTVVNGNGLNSFNRDFEGTTQNPVPNLHRDQVALMLLINLNMLVNSRIRILM